MVSELCLIVVEDNESLREEMVSFLSRPGWVAHGVDCGEELNDWLTRHTPDIAVLDVNLPYEDGYCITTRLRASHPQLGIIMLTARVRHGERTKGYQAGADVYLTKPTSAPELVAVIENLSRRLNVAPVAKPLTPWQLSRERSRLFTPDGASCVLTPTEVRVLELMTLSHERTVEVDFLAHALMRVDGKVVSRESLAVLMSRLRQKVKQSLGFDDVVISRRGQGYQLTVALSIQAT